MVKFIMFFVKVWYALVMCWYYIIYCWHYKRLKTEWAKHLKHERKRTAHDRLKEKQAAKLASIKLRRKVLREKLAQEGGITHDEYDKATGATSEEEGEDGA